MISKSLQQMIKGRWKEFKREPSAMFFVVLMPVLWMVILGLAFSDPKQDKATIAMFKTDQSEIGQRIEAIIKRSPEITVKIGSQKEAQIWLAKNEIDLSLSIADDGHLSYKFDPSNPTAYQNKEKVNNVIQSGLGRKDVINYVEEKVSTPGNRYIDFLVPGLLALSLFTSSLFGTGMTIVAHRRENLLKRYRATPMRPSEYIISHIIGRLMIFGVEFFTIIATGVLLFNFQISGAWIDFLLISLLGATCFTAIGILCGSRVNNTSTYNGINNIITLPMMMVAGVWFSRSHYPEWLHRLTDFLPLTACVDALRKISHEGQSIFNLGFEMSVLGMFAILCTIAAHKNFKWY